MGAHLAAPAAEINPCRETPQRERAANMQIFQGAVDRFPKKVVLHPDTAGDDDMVHLIAFLFFTGVLAGLAVLLQYTLRDNWADMVAAFMGRPMPSRAVTPQAVTVKAVHSKMRRAAA
jgi:hypothetical protein